MNFINLFTLTHHSVQKLNNEKVNNQPITSLQ